MVNEKTVISNTREGLANNRSELLAALAEQGELGRARFAAQADEQTRQQQALLQQANARGDSLGAPVAGQAEIDAMIAARRGYLSEIQANQAAAYERARTSMMDRNATYIDQIGDAAIFQQQELDATIAAQKQILDAEYAARAAAARGSGGGGSSASPLAGLAGLQAPGQQAFIHSPRIAAERANVSYDDVQSIQDRDPDLFGQLLNEIDSLIAGGRFTSVNDLARVLRAYGYDSENDMQVLGPVFGQMFFETGRAPSPVAPTPAGPPVTTAESFHTNGPGSNSLYIPPASPTRQAWTDEEAREMARLSNESRYS